QMRPRREASSGPQIQTDEVTQGDLQGKSDNVSSCPWKGVSDCVQSDLFSRRVDSPELGPAGGFSECPRMDWSHPRSEAEERLSGAPHYSGVEVQRPIFEGKFGTREEKKWIPDEPPDVIVKASSWGFIN
ncbi:Hypothetical predicted protein, partial [Marmota monax]